MPTSDLLRVGRRSSRSGSTGSVARIGLLAVANYQRSQMTTTAQLLLSSDPDQFLKQASTAQAYAGQQTAVLRRYQNASGKLADLQNIERSE